MTASEVPRLTMSQTKDDLLKHLQMSPETYTMMAKETDRVYKWLTSDPAHLKKNCKRKPPYDWSDIVEKAKDQAMKHIAESGDPCTSHYWNLASPTSDCPNWIARWFLYHKFRYRDGRNRNTPKGGEKSREYTNHVEHSYSYDGHWDKQYQYQQSSMSTVNSNTSQYYAQPSTASYSPNSTTYAATYDITYTSPQNHNINHGTHDSGHNYDPVRDDFR